MKIKKIAIAVVLTGVVGSLSVAGATEINARKNISNSGMNKVASARLRGMFASMPKNTIEKNRPFGRRGCVTEIGSQSTGNNLLGQPRDIVINGNVTNVCF